MNSASLNTCIVIPVYNHEEAVGIIVDKLRLHRLPIILVNDGSSETCSAILDRIAEQFLDVDLLVLPENRGKGGAVKAGLKYALEQGFSHAIQIDADGQHNTDDIGRFLDEGSKAPEAIICGYPAYDETVPKHRYYARYLTHVWIWINSLSLSIVDSMCGFRLYPLPETVALINEEHVGDRMDFDSEIMVRWVWRQGQVVNLQTAVSYPIDGVSHFALFSDNVLITKMHTRLFFGMLVRLPKLLWRKVSPHQKAANV